MLGIPQFDPYGATVTTVLNPFIVPGQYAILESRFQPSGNGKYQILSVEHQGELRGNQFETKIRLFRDNTKNNFFCCFDTTKPGLNAFFTSDKERNHQ